MRQRIREIIADVTGNSVHAVGDNSSHQTVEGWDSLAQINIIVTVESEFGVAFSAEEMHGLNSVHAICEALQRTSAKAGLV
jgi:acyl carrier protein